MLRDLLFPETNKRMMTGEHMAKRKAQDLVEVEQAPSAPSVQPTEVSKKVAGTTKKGKNLNIKQDKLGYWVIQFEDGGQLPAGLKGKFTQHQVAQDSINTYLAGKK